MIDPTLARVERCLARTEAQNPSLKSLIAVLPDEAREAARRIDANRAAMHYGVRDYDDTMPRFMWRVTAAGDRPG